MMPRSTVAGFALASAVFLIAVLAVLGLVMATMAKVEHDTGVKSLLSDKVYYGAKAGLEWGIQRAIAAGSCVAAPTTFPPPPMQEALSEVTVTVECTQSPHGTAPPTNQVYYLKSTAEIGTAGSFDRAERRMEATVSNIP